MTEIQPDFAVIDFFLCRILVVVSRIRVETAQVAEIRALTRLETGHPGIRVIWY